MLSCTLSIVLHSVYLCLTVRHKQIGPTLGVSGGLCAVRQHLCINNKMAMCDILCDTLKFSKYDMHAHNKYFRQHFYCIHWECRPHFETVFHFITVVWRVMVYSHWVELGPRQERGLESEQWGTIGLGPCPISGAMQKLLHSFIQPICSRSRFRPVCIGHKY